MAAEMEFTIGARASCSDGHCGEVKRLVFDPATETVTHLVIQHGHRPEAGRLVPAHLAETTGGEIRLRCTLAEFDKFDHAEEREVADAADQHVGDVGGAPRLGLGIQRQRRGIRPRRRLESSWTSAPCPRQDTAGR